MTKIRGKGAAKRPTLSDAYWQNDRDVLVSALWVADILLECYAVTGSIPVRQLREARSGFRAALGRSGPLPSDLSPTR